jgi:ubiquinone biosynthesis protein COQ9
MVEAAGMTVERSAARDAAVEAMLPLVPYHGWCLATLRKAGVADGDLLFPGGTGDLIEVWLDLADRRMAEAPLPEGLGLTGRVRELVARRLSQAGPHKAAVRRALAWMALPGHAAVSARSAARTVEAIWHAAGDRSADISWYSKRAILAGVYGSVLLYWVGHPDDAAALAFLDRQLARVGAIGRSRFMCRRAA